MAYAVFKTHVREIETSKESSCVSEALQYHSPV